MEFNSPKKGSKILRNGLKKWKTVMMLGKHSLDSSGRSRSSRGSSFQSSDRTADPIGRQDLEEATGPFKRFLPFLRRQQKEIQETGAKLRQQYTEGRLWFLITIVTLPMIAIQICLLALFPPGQMLVLNEDESVGRCKSEADSRSTVSARHNALTKLFVFVSADECGDRSSQKFQLPSVCIVFVTIVIDLFQVQGYVVWASSYLSWCAAMSSHLARFLTARNHFLLFSTRPRKCPMD